MSRSVNDVNLRTFPVYADVLRENGYSAFTFQVVRIEHLVAEVLSLTEEVSCEHHLIHEGGFSMVNMGNNGYVSYILHIVFY